MIVDFGYLSFSFDADTSLGRIHLEDPKSACSIVSLKQAILPDLTAVPAKSILSFAIKPHDFACLAYSHDIRLIFIAEVGHLLQINAHLYLHKANPTNVPPLVEPLQTELL